MTTYVCVRDFTTSLGKHYFTGTEITNTQYAILSYADKLNFRRKEEPAAYSRESESFIPSPFDHMLGSSPQSESEPESPSFGGYGGGDGGGGGASGSWDSEGDSGGGDGGGGGE